MTCTINICGCLHSERSQGRRTPSTRFLMLPLRSSTCTQTVSVNDISLVVPRHVASLSRMSTQHPRVNVSSAETQEHDARAQSQLPSSAKSQKNRPSTEPASSVLDELVSWRKLKEPLERYMEFVRYNYFGNTERTTDAQRHEVDDSVENSTDSLGLTVSASKIHQHDERLLQRPKAEPLHIVSHYHQ